MKVQEEEVFFLGDNRGNSLDARTNGCLPLSDVVGVVTSFSLAHKDFIAGWVRFWHPGSPKRYTKNTEGNTMNIQITQTAPATSAKAL